MKTEAVRWGIMSTANIATKVGNAIHSADSAELVAVASRTQKRAEAWAYEHNVPRAYGNYEDLLNAPDVDAIYLPTPPSMHAEWTIKAAEHGKHVLCEKPLSITTDEAIAMADACQRNGVQLMDGVMWVHHKRTAEMRAIIDDGTLGRLRRVTAAFTFNWDTIPENNIRAQKEVGGGCLGDLGYYCVRAILWAFGDLPTQVFGTARDKVGVEFNLSGLLWFADERMASFDCGFDTGSRKWFEVAGTKGSLICDDFTVPWSAETARFWIHGTAGKDAEHRVEGCIQEVEMIERFSNIVRTGELDTHWQTVAIDTMRVCDALLASARQGEVKKL